MKKPSKSAEVALRAFDLQGRQVAELLRGTYAAGAHRLSVFANRLAGTQGLVFRLEAAATSFLLTSS